MFRCYGRSHDKVTASFNAVLIDDVGNISYDEDANCFVIYDGEKDGKLIDPLS